MSIYTELKAAGVALDSHESDLYFEWTETAKQVIYIAQANGRDIRPQLFTCEVTGDTWAELPFCYDPWWAARDADTASMEELEAASDILDRVSDR